MEDWKITDLEKKLIATILFADAFDIAERNEIQSIHFTSPVRRNLFVKMEEMHKEGKSVSSDLVFIEIKNIGISSQDFFEIVKTETDIHFSSNLEAFCQVIKLEYKKRKMHDFLLSSAKKLETEGIKAIEDITLNFTSLEKETSNSTIKKVSELQESILNALDQEEDESIKCGIHSFDRPLGGLKAGKLLVLAARPGMGKTAYALCLLEGIVEQGIPSGFISLEMTEQELIERMICMQGFDNNNIRKELHRKDQNIRNQYINHLNAVCSIPLFIDEDSGITEIQVRQKLYFLASKGVKVVVIDYLQLIRLPGKKLTTEEIGDITRMLKSLAKKLKMTIILLSQLSREVEKRADKLPQLSDLRSSGDIEQDADAVIFLFRPEYYIDKMMLSEDDVINKIQMQTNETAVIFDKNRGGVTCRQYCTFEGKYYRFKNEVAESKENSQQSQYIDIDTPF